MTDARQALLAARDQIDIALAALGESVASQDDPLTARLDLSGLWVPDWLDKVNEPYRQRADALGNIGPLAPDHDGDPSTMSRGKLQLASGFYFDKCRERQDLTPAQINNIFRWVQHAAGTISDIYRDEATGLIRMGWTWALDAVPETAGSFPLAIGWNRDYKSGDEVKRAYERMLYLTYDR